MGVLRLLRSPVTSAAAAAETASVAAGTPVNDEKPMKGCSGRFVEAALLSSCLHAARQTVTEG